MAVTNTVGSAITREADAVLFLQAGPGGRRGGHQDLRDAGRDPVLLAAAVAGRGGASDARGVGPRGRPARAAGGGRASHRAREHWTARDLAERYVGSRGFMYIGRGIGYPAALEGALKIKEISYVHAEGYAAGELKHGPISLLDAEVPLVAVATRSARVRQADQQPHGGQRPRRPGHGRGDRGRRADRAPGRRRPLGPRHARAAEHVLAVIPLQLFAYHVAVARGTDVDQPRNLAKSVTVE